MLASTFCLDIAVGYNEDERESLIRFLSTKKHADGLIPHIGTAERGMYEGTKILRIRSHEADELQQYILDFFDNVLVDDFDFTIHHTILDAQRDMHYLPDFDTKYGYSHFEL